MSEKIVYVAELDADVDDVVAAEYLHSKGVLECVVMDPAPKTPVGLNRKRSLEALGVKFQNDIPSNTDYVFVGGALTKVCDYIQNGGKLKALVMNGGFVGSNIAHFEDQLFKFLGKETVRTFNFNLDINATEQILRTSESVIGDIYLIGKNVCHHEKNTANGLWKKECQDLLQKYKVKQDKRQHDLLACHEGLAMLGLGGVHQPYCAFLEVYPFNTGVKGTMTKWGSKRTNLNTPYRKVCAAVSYLPEGKKAYEE